MQLRSRLSALDALSSQIRCRQKIGRHPAYVQSRSSVDDDQVSRSRGMIALLSIENGADEMGIFLRTAPAKFIPEIACPIRNRAARS